MMTNSKKRKIKKIMHTIPDQLVMILVSFIILFPLYYVFVNSFKTSGEFLSNMFGLPKDFTLANYISIFQGKSIITWFFNSTFLALASTVATTAIGLLAAYAFAKMWFPGKSLLFKLIIPLTAVPPVAMLIPQFKLVSYVGMLNTLPSVVFIYTGLMLPMTIYMLRNFMISIPDTLLEAGIIDGCSKLGVLVRIVVPISRSAIITAGLVNLVWAWNELLIALVFLQKEELRTIIVGITMMKGRYTLNVPKLLSGLAVVCIPIVLLYIFAQKYIVAGLVEGAVKE